MNKPPRDLLSVALFILFWSLEIFVTKAAFLAGAKVLPFMVQSAIFALIFMGFWTVPREFKRLISLCTVDRVLLKQICIANLIHYAIGSSLYCSGTALTSAINVAFLVTLCTPITCILAIFILGESLSIRKAFVLCVLLSGAYILTTNLQMLVPRLGDLLILSAAFFWSLGNVLMRKTLRDSEVSGEVVSFLKPIIGLPLFILLVQFSDYYPTAVSSIFAEPILQFNYLGYAAVAGIFAALLWIFLYRSLKNVESAYVSMLGMLTPVIVSILAVLFLGEKLSPMQGVGSLIILISAFARTG
jgi:drug/metabolite transporter (DMT)-like permease